MKLTILAIGAAGIAALTSNPEPITPDF